MERIKNLAKPKYTIAQTAINNVRRHIDQDDFKNNQVPSKVILMVVG